MHFWRNDRRLDKRLTVSWNAVLKATFLGYEEVMTVTVSNFCLKGVLLYTDNLSVLNQHLMISRHRPDLRLTIHTPDGEIESRVEIRWYTWSCEKNLFEVGVNFHRPAGAQPSAGGPHSRRPGVCHRNGAPIVPLAGPSPYIRCLSLANGRRLGYEGDGSAKRPIPALRCISKSLRRTLVRLTPLRFARLGLGLFSKPSKFCLTVSSSCPPGCVCNTLRLPIFGGCRHRPAPAGQTNGSGKPGLP